MLNGSCGRRYNILKARLANTQLLGDDQYPKSRETALNLLNHFQAESYTTPTMFQEDVAFIQADANVDTVAGDSPKTNSKGQSECFHCGKADHWSYACPKLTGKEREELTKKYKARRGDRIHTQVCKEVSVGDFPGSEMCIGDIPTCATNPGKYGSSFPPHCEHRDCREAGDKIIAACMQAAATGNHVAQDYIDS